METGDSSSMALSITGVGLTIGNKEILGNVNLKVTAGENIALVGASGAGKSSLFRTIVGGHEGTSGEILLLGQTVLGLKGTELRRLRSRVGFIAQGVDLVDSASALENVLHGALPRFQLPLFNSVGCNRSSRAWVGRERCA